VIASGYEPVLLVTKRAQYLTGIIRREDASIIELVDSQGRSRLVPKREVARRVPQTTSLMPENFAEILTVQEFRDLLAYVLTLQ
jgi:putative heme-binding domain-containing protein